MATVASKNTGNAVKKKEKKKKAQKKNWFIYLFFPHKIMTSQYLNS
jgi:hypothetical protein